MSLDYLKEILTKGNEAADKSARSKKLAAEVSDKILLPIEERVAAKEGPGTESIGGTSSTKPQFIAEYRLELPEIEGLIPQLRFALANDKKKDAEIHVGVTIGQAHSDPKTAEVYPAHLRWGAWCVASDKVKRVQGPLRVINRYVEDTLEVMTPRPIANKANGTLSICGKLLTVEDLDDYESFEALADQIADDICKLAVAVVPAPVEEDEEGEEAQA